MQQESKNVPDDENVPMDVEETQIMVTEPEVSPTLEPNEVTPPPTLKQNAAAKKTQDSSTQWEDVGPLFHNLCRYSVRNFTSFSVHIVFH